MTNYYCYLLTSNKGTYIGITNNLKNRLHHHNNTKSGARATKGAKWKFHTVIGNFTSRNTAQRFEWYWKHYKNSNDKWVRTKSGIINKMKRLLQLLLNNEWKHLNIIDYTTLP